MVVYASVFVDVLFVVKCS